MRPHPSAVWLACVSLVVDQELSRVLATSADRYAELGMKCLMQGWQEEEDEEEEKEEEDPTTDGRERKNHRTGGREDLGKRNGGTGQRGGGRTGGCTKRGDDVRRFSQRRF